MAPADETAPPVDKVEPTRKKHKQMPEEEKLATQDIDQLKKQLQFKDEAETCSTKDKAEEVVCPEHANYIKVDTVILSSEAHSIGTGAEGRSIEDNSGNVSENVGTDDKIHTKDAGESVVRKTESGAEVIVDEEQGDKVNESTSEDQGQGNAAMEAHENRHTGMVSDEDKGWQADNGGKRVIATTNTSSEENSTPSKGKIFIGGLTRDTSREMLTSHFERYGEITDAVIMKNRSTGHPRGFGFVTFADPSVVDTVLQDDHVLGGKKVEAKRTVPREAMPVQSKGPKTKKIFVGGLKTSTTEEELKDFFEKFGRVTEHQIMQDHGSRRSRGFGFVTFESEQIVEDLLVRGKMLELDGKQVEIKKAEPKRDDPPPTHRSSQVGGRGSAVPTPSRGGFIEAFSGGMAPFYGVGGYNVGHGRSGGYLVGSSYGYGSGYGGMHNLLDVGSPYTGMGMHHEGSGSGYDYGSRGAYGSSSRSYGMGRYHPYSR